jgi:signal transduction histidine kinase
MNINPFVYRDFSTVDAYEGVKEAKPRMIERGSLVVLENNKPIGLLTLLDLIHNPCNLVIDCLTEKPGIQIDSKVEDALSIMEETNAYALAVYEDKTIIGTLNKSDLTDYMIHSFKTHRDNLHGVVHDLQSPIANVINILNIMEDSMIESGNLELLSYAKVACANANILISELLNPQQQSTIVEQGEIIDIKRLIEECIQDMQVALQKKRVEVSVNFPETKMFIYGKQVAIKRIITNLLNNALKFSKIADGIQIEAMSFTDHCIVRIIDHGVGIPDNMKPYIFDKYTKAKRVGTLGENTNGMGLYITKNICEKNAIALSFESQEGKGTVFNLKFKCV